VRYDMTKAGKGRTIAKNFINQCVIDFDTLIGEKFSNIIKKMPLSNDSLSRGIRKISTENENEVI
jgi:hypothetical protein